MAEIERLGRRTRDITQQSHPALTHTSVQRLEEFTSQLKDQSSITFRFSSPPSSTANLSARTAYLKTLQSLTQLGVPVFDRETLLLLIEEQVASGIGHDLIDFGEALALIEVNHESDSSVVFELRAIDAANQSLLAIEEVTISKAGGAGDTLGRTDSISAALGQQRASVQLGPEDKLKYVVRARISDPILPRQRYTHLNSKGWGWISSIHVMPSSGNNQWTRDLSVNRIGLSWRGYGGFTPSEKPLKHFVDKYYNALIPYNSSEEHIRGIIIALVLIGFFENGELFPGLTRFFIEEIAPILTDDPSGKENGRNRKTWQTD